MKIVLYADNTLPIPLQTLCEVINKVCTGLSMSVGVERVRFDTEDISFPGTYTKLPPSVMREIKQYDEAYIATAIPYDNNYFFESAGQATIFSFANWNHLTDLPITNGLVYFLASCLADKIGYGRTHQTNTGCINDFWGDKTGINLGMRAAFVCETCRQSFHPSDDREKNLAEDVLALLNLVSKASRLGQDIISFRIPEKSSSVKTFDLFLSHNSEDKDSIRQINRAIMNQGVRTWFDEDQLTPGKLWQVELEEQIDAIRAAAVFVGPNGLGPWESMEMRAFLSEFNERKCPVIPVILKNANSIPKLPIFLRQFTWIDLRKDYEKNLLRLVDAVKK